MKEKLHKIIRIGYGLGLLSAAQAKKAVEQLKKDLHLSDEESLKVARELVATSEKVTRDVLKTVDKHFSAALVKTKVVKKKDIARVKKMLKKRASQLRMKVMGKNKS